MDNEIIRKIIAQVAVEHTARAFPNPMVGQRKISRSQLRVIIRKAINDALRELREIS